MRIYPNGDKVDNYLDEAYILVTITPQNTAKMDGFIRFTRPSLFNCTAVL